MIISRTPLRISFAGGGSDLKSYYSCRPYGAVVSTAIDKYIYITVNRRIDDDIRISYSTTEVVKSIGEIKHNIIREALKLTNIQHGVEVVYMGDVPLGSAGIGLASSSALAVGVLNALHALSGKHVSAHQLAEEACHIEIDLLKNPIGKQDQFIAAYGGLQRIQFNHDDSVFVDPVILSKNRKNELNHNLMLFYTGITRISSNILEEQNKNAESNLDGLDKIVSIGQKSVEALQRNDLRAFGELLHDSWELKRKLASGITSPQIDAYYQKAMDAGAIGGKLLGAGGGGFLLFYCEGEKQKQVRDALKELDEHRFQFEPQGSKIIYIH